MSHSADTDRSEEFIDRREIQIDPSFVARAYEGLAFLFALQLRTSTIFSVKANA